MMTVVSRWILWGLIAQLLCAALAWSEPRVELREGWQLKAWCLAPESGAMVSTPEYRPRQWIPATVPSTVLNALIKHGIYPDLRVGTNAYLIPDSSDEFNQQHGLAKYSYLPDKRNPWREPYWYRTEFELPEFPPGRRTWLHFDAINYRAEVWLNGRQIADKENMAGMFQRFEYEITAQVKKGKNVLAVKVFPVDHPGVPDQQLPVLGKDRGYVGRDIMKDVTEIMTIGYDCMMTVPDRNMGLWQPVWIDWSGPVKIRDPFVSTELPLPETNRATLKVSAELGNATGQSIKGTLVGKVLGTELLFEMDVALGAHETKLVKIDPQPVLANPRLWWPVNYGEQYLYTLDLEFHIDQNPDSPVSNTARIWRGRVDPRPVNALGLLSDQARVSFGVRQVGSRMHEIDGWHGRQVLINGQKIFCRGGYIQPELIFDWDARRMETEIRYYAAANLNLIYFEDIPNPPEPFLELCDRYGVLFGACHYSCYWLRPGTPYPSDFGLLEKCTVDLVKRYRNHPSLIMYMAMNEEDTRREVYEMWRQHIIGLDGTRWFIPSAYFPSDRKNAGEWFKPDLPTGMTDKGASYSWAEPAQYFRWVREKRNWMFMMESGSASLPPMSSLSRFLPEVLRPESPGRDPHFPLNADWAHHGANNYYKGYDAALRRLHGEPESVADYAWKGHLVTADQHRSMFEAVNHRLWDVTSGFTQWKINACEPSVQWQIFDWYHKPMVSWFYIKKACEPLHVQLNLPDKMVSVINTRLTPQTGLQVRARVFDLASQLRWEKTATVEIGANTFREFFEVPEPATNAPIYFVKLELKDAAGRIVSDSFYWLAAPGVPDYKALQSLPPVKLQTRCQFEGEGPEKLARVQITNPADRIAFFVQVALTQRGQEILPVWWEDNYFSLLPGETRELTARFEPARAGKPLLEVGGWNVESEFECAKLEVSLRQIKAGEQVYVSAQIEKTFLDGSRVWLMVDGKPAAGQWAWARLGRSQMVTFTTKCTEPGQHEIAVGGKKTKVMVK